MSNTQQSRIVCPGVVCVDNAHQYRVNGNQTIQFIKRQNGVLVEEGTTNEELLAVLLDRTRELNKVFPCEENEQAILRMGEALMWFNERTSKRIAQGVETRALPHVS